jgi:hypothetical protein
MSASTATVVAVFQEKSRAQIAIRELRNAGFGEDQLGVISREAPDATSDPESMWEEGAVTGGVAGAGVGGLWALGIAASVLPPVGPAIAGGLLASVLVSAVGGAAVGGIVGGLVGLGIPESEAQYLDGEFKAGRTIVTVRPAERGDDAVTILRRNGGDVRSGVPASAGTVGPAFSGPGQATGPLQR